MLRPIQGLFQPQDYPDLLVGLGEADDAAVWHLDDKHVLVATTDFFTPVVDDPYDFGAIAATNALSDIYAMGGRPFLALNIAALPPDLPPEITGEILRGGAEKVRQAGAVLAGGHTIQDKEPKYGLVALGFADPKHILTKGGARPGDILVLSKPLGFGVTTTAIKRGQAAAEDVIEVVEWMKRLNQVASDLAVRFNLKSGTDITGFSLLGHSTEMAGASHVGFRFHFDKIPFTRGAKRYAAEWTFPGGASDNRLHFGPQVHFDSPIDEPYQMLLFDPQTSGGLLLAVPADRISDFMDVSRQVEQPVWIVGEVIDRDGIVVV